MVKSFTNYSSATYARNNLLQQFPADLGLQVSAADCLKQKLNGPQSTWTACTAASKTPEPKIMPDSTFLLKGAGLEPGFKVYTKIVDTIPGNSDPSAIDYLEPGAGVTGSSAGVTPQHIPAIYRFEVQGERQTNPREKAILSVLYAY